MEDTERDEWGAEEDEPACSLGEPAERKEEIRRAHNELVLERVKSGVEQARERDKLLPPSFTLCADDLGALEMLNAYADYLVKYGKDADIPRRVKNTHRLAKRMREWLEQDGLREIAVCKSCSRACCLAYVQQCEAKKGMVMRRVSYLRSLRLEHPSWLR